MADLDYIRSLYFAPGTDADRIRAGLESGADALFADLEDLVPDDEKASARRTVATVFATAAAGGPALLVRVNPPSSPHARDDLALIGQLPLAGLVVPLATPKSVEHFAACGLPVIAMVETGGGVRAAYEIAAIPGTVRLTIGPGDLARDLHLEPAEPESLLYVRSKLVVDSAAAGIAGPLDFPGRGDGAGFRDNTMHGRSLGCRGRLCFTEAQVKIVNEVYG